MLIRNKPDPWMEAWQLTTDQPIVDYPNWVRSAIVERDPEGYIIERSTGRQLVRVGEWLIRDLDKVDVIHEMDTDLKQYERRV